MGYIYSCCSINAIRWSNLAKVRRDTNEILLLVADWSISRSFERIIGSLIGAIFAEFTVYVASVVPYDGLTIAFTFGFLYYFLATYLQHSTAYDRPYSL